MLHKSHYTESELAALKFKFQFSTHCKECGEEIAVYQNISSNKYLRLNEGSMEVHECS